MSMRGRVLGRLRGAEKIKGLKRDAEKDSFKAKEQKTTTTDEIEGQHQWKTSMENINGKHQGMKIKGQHQCMITRDNINA